jgi:hypothetical protein
MTHSSIQDATSEVVDRLKGAIKSTAESVGSVRLERIRSVQKKLTI